MKKTPLVLGTALAAALLTPSLASASTCTPDFAAKTATIQMDTPFIRVSPAFDGTILRADNPNGGNSSCSGATLNNIDRLIIKGTPGFEEVELNEGMHTFAGGATPEPTGRSSLNVSAFTGSGGDV